MEGWEATADAGGCSSWETGENSASEAKYCLFSVLVVLMWREAWAERGKLSDRRNILGSIFWISVASKGSQIRHPQINARDTTAAPDFFSLASGRHF